ncbi:DNA gyrase subunit B [Streptomyces laurentii]|uniref:DNA topoisomerase (ATP-hydrolyzing) n=1 Tax=Streptomyces laurentii TaxID=39478 RepID=A0A169PFZ2_STRLU|nr:DNA gyrase subunit B [Streptomyces laurentii]
MDGGGREGGGDRVHRPAARPGLTAVVSIRLDRPEFEGAPRAVLGNAEVRESVASAVQEHLLMWLTEDPRLAAAAADRITADPRPSDA